jgi:ribosome-associated heat shock protein Hsp15
MDKKVRVDKWLWAVRIFKTRSLASDAIKGGRVKIGSTTLKPASLVKENDVVIVKKDGFNLQFKVVEVIEKRVGAPIAATCLENLTPIDELNKYKAWFASELRARGLGRPTKKDRRELENLKDGENADTFAWDELDEISAS